MDEIDDTTARELRTTWFRYLDSIEPLRPDLFRYCLKLTRDPWDAEDLVQDTLLKGFAMIGRGDLHGPGSPVASAKAYLFRCASHQWIDAQRRAARQRAFPADPPPAREPAPETTRAAAEALFAAASPQARAAVILKDVFDFTLDEIADLLRTTVGGVKSALHRGREALADPEPSRRPGPPPELVDRFVDAFRARDVGRLTAVLSEACSIEVPGVGGGRGRRGGWAEASLGHEANLRPADYRGETVVLFTDDAGRLYDVVRLEGEDGLVTRIVNHCYCPDLVTHVAAELGLDAAPLGYHQPPDILPRMIATTTMPWGSPGAQLHA